MSRRMSKALVLLLGGFRLWPGIALGAFAANALTPVPIGVVAGISAGNTLESPLPSAPRIEAGQRCRPS